MMRKTLSFEGKVHSAKSETFAMRHALCAMRMALAAVLLTGCTMIPEYTRPEPPIPSDWPSGPAYQGVPPTKGAPPAADLEWREFFKDERLQGIIEAALENNRDLRVAALNVERVRAFYRIQRAELLPTIDAVGIGVKDRVPADLSATRKRMTVEHYSVDLGIISWEIDFFGRIRSLEDRALEEYLATEEARRSVQILLVSAVSNAYLTLAADREGFKLARSTLASQEEAYTLVRRRYELGLASELDLRQAQTQVESARGDIALFTRRVAQDENGLNLLVGSPSPVPTDLLPADLAGVKPPREISPGIPSEVLLARPDIMAEEHRLKAANANIGAARAAFFPRISLTSTLGTASRELTDLFKSGQSTWSFAPQIVAPIFDSRLWSAYDATKVEREIALAQYEKAIQTAFSEVADALAISGTVDHQLSAQESLTDAVAETYRLSNSRYRWGFDSYLGVLDAQRSLYVAQQALITIRLVKLANQVRLYAVLGGGGGPVMPREGE